MDLSHTPIIWALLLVCSRGEQQYFPHHNKSNWKQARKHCQLCYKELVSLSPENSRTVIQNLSSDYWIGYRKNLDNFTDAWSRWSNGDPVSFQNWYPGRPILHPPKDPVVHVCNITNLSPVAANPPCECCCSSSAMPAASAGTTESGQGPNTTTASTSGNEMYYTTLFLDPLSNITNGQERGYVSPKCECCCCCCAPNDTSNGTTTSNSTVEMLTAKLMTTITYTSPLLNRVGNGTNDTNKNNNTQDAYIEDPCVSVRSFGMWLERNCTELLPYICYEDRFYGEVWVGNITNDTGSLNWLAGPGDITGYRLEVTGGVNLTINLTDLSYQLVNLTAGTFYKIKIFPIKCERDLNPQNISFYTKPGFVKNLTIENIAEGSVILSWYKPDGNSDFYHIQVEGQPEIYTNTTITKGEVKGLSSGSRYTFEVSAQVSDNSQKGEIQSRSAYTKPNVVTKLVASNESNTSIRLDWTPPEGNTSGYRVQAYMLNRTTNQTLFQKNVTENFLLVEPLPAGTVVWLSVVALVLDGSVDGNQTVIESHTKPGPIRNLSFESDQNSILVSWTPPKGNYEKFSVLLHRVSPSQNTTIDTNETFYNFTQLTAAAEFNVKVQSVNGRFYSDALSASIFTLPVMPQSASIGNYNMTSITLNWVAPVDTVTVTYKVNYTSPFWGQFLNTTVQNLTSITFSGLHPGSRYVFNVSTVAGGLESLPVRAETLTAPNASALTLSMECSSQSLLFCENATTQMAVLDKLKAHFNAKFNQDVSWDVQLKT